MKLFLALTAATASAYIDECSQYPTCQDCLNVGVADLNAEGTGLGEHAANLTTRPNCGWCHFNIQYADGTTGARCADVRDKPFKCHDLFDTYQCTVGFNCDPSQGKCGPSKAGEGYSSLTTCEQYYPDGCAAQSQYKCNVTNYQCQKCAASETGCETQTECGANCKSPPTPAPTPTPPPTPKKPTPPPAPQNSYKCNHTTYKCEQCTDAAQQEGCAKASTACANCHAPISGYTCNQTSLMCQPDPKSQTSSEQCQGGCTNSTPPELQGKVYRGLAAHKGFATGEWDYQFQGSNQITIRDPAGDVHKGTVSTINGVLTIKLTDGAQAGKTMKAIQPLLNNGEETDTMALAFGDYNQDQPTDLADAMLGKGKRVHILHKCKDNTAAAGGKCDFTPAMTDSDSEDAAPLTLSPSNPFNIYAGALGASDGCNAFTTCDKCINASAGGLKCGWCMGGTIKYNDTSMPTGMQCGGFQDGQPKAFTCAPEFRTAGCDGYTCDYQQSPPKCMEDPQGKSPTMEACQNGGGQVPACKVQSLTKCNADSKQCEECPAGSTDKDCKYTKDQCDAICAAPHQKCNYATKQCESCEFGKDPNCTMTTGQCGPFCKSQTFGICNKTTGKCDTCDPQATTGCVQKCSDTCSKAPTPPPTPSPPTPKPPTPPTPRPTPKPETFYSCNWQANPPKCKEDNSSHTTQEECSTQCQAATFAVCNTTTYKCDTCTQGSTGCSQTAAVCAAGCKNSSKTGTYRAIEISTGFARGEWDFTFYKDGKIGFGYLSPSGSLFKYEATVGSHFELGATESTLLTLTQVPSGGPITATVGQKLSGMFENKAGFYQLTDYMYLALSKPDGQTPASFEAGMSQIEFVLVKCHKDDGSNCDFSSAQVPE
jgi:hypothetical protein